MKISVFLMALGVASAAPNSLDVVHQARDNSARLGGFNFGSAKGVFLPGEDGTRVVNGVEVPEGDFKFAASLKMIKSQRTYSTCTGSLIAENVILTAGHCLFKGTDILFSAKDVTVGVGDIRSVDGGNPNLYRVSKLVPHPRYKPNALVNDLGLMFLEKSVSPSIAKPVEFYTGDVGKDISLEAAGWGVVDNDNTQTDVIMKVPLSVGDRATCKRAYALWTSNDDRTVCTVVVNSQDTCYGDSGGPLVTGDGENQTLVGLTSFGDDLDTSTGHALCGNNGGVGYYTHANYYADWINTEINKFNGRSSKHVRSRKFSEHH